MSSKVVRDAFETYINNNWVATVIVGEENEFESPPDNLDPWLTFGFLSGPEDKRSIGGDDSCYQETGQVIITVFVASGTGTQDALTYAESVRTMMRAYPRSAGIRVITVDPPETSFPSRVNASSGNFFGYQVVANYTYDYTA